MMGRHARISINTSARKFDLSIPENLPTLFPHEILSMKILAADDAKMTGKTFSARCTVSAHEYSDSVFAGMCAAPMELPS